MSKKELRFNCSGGWLLSFWVWRELGARKSKKKDDSKTKEKALCCCCCALDTTTTNKQTKSKAMMMMKEKLLIIYENKKHIFIMEQQFEMVMATDNSNNMSILNSAYYRSSIHIQPLFRDRCAYKNLWILDFITRCRKYIILVTNASNLPRFFFTAVTINLKFYR